MTTIETAPKKPRLKMLVYVFAAFVGLVAYGMFLIHKRQEMAIDTWKAQRAKGYELVAEFEGCKVFKNGSGEVVAVGSPGVVCTYQ